MASLHLAARSALQHSMLPHCEVLAPIEIECAILTVIIDTSRPDGNLDVL